MAEKTGKKESVEKKETPKPKCGIIMPISAIDSYSAEHWMEVKGIIEEVISQTEFQCDLVSNANEVRIIHETIVQNIYFNEMIICDISGKNPNVMFELGLRIAFDKPAIIIKDDITDYSFDTSPIEHLTYPRDLNYNKINVFKDSLRNKLNATYEKSKEGNFSPFLKSFGRFEVAGLDTKEISSESYILKSLDELKTSISRLENKSDFERSLEDIRQRQSFNENIKQRHSVVIPTFEFPGIGTTPENKPYTGIIVMLETIQKNLSISEEQIESWLSQYFQAKASKIKTEGEKYNVVFNRPLTKTEILTNISQLIKGTSLSVESITLRDT